MGDKLLRRCNKAPVVLQPLLLAPPLLLALLTLLQLPIMGVVLVAARLGRAGDVLPLPQSPLCRTLPAVVVVEPVAKSVVVGSYH